MVQQLTTYWQGLVGGTKSDQGIETVVLVREDKILHPGGDKQQRENSLFRRYCKGRHFLKQQMASDVCHLHLIALL